MAPGSELAPTVHLKETALRMGSFAIDTSLVTKPQSHRKPVNKLSSQPVWYNNGRFIRINKIEHKVFLNGKDIFALLLIDFGKNLH